jgi:hypothetical protein
MKPPLEFVVVVHIGVPVGSSTRVRDGPLAQLIVMEEMCTAMPVLLTMVQLRSVPVGIGVGSVCLSFELLQTNLLTVRLVGLGLLEISVPPLAVAEARFVTDPRMLSVLLTRYCPVQVTEPPTGMVVLALFGTEQLAPPGIRLSLTE